MVRKFCHMKKKKQKLFTCDRCNISHGKYINLTSSIQIAPCILGTSQAASFSRIYRTAPKLGEAASATAVVCSASDRVRLLQFNFLKLVNEGSLNMLSHAIIFHKILSHINKLLFSHEIFLAPLIFLDTLPF